MAALQMGISLCALSRTRAHGRESADRGYPDEDFLPCD
jgi:hypothetical protein